MNVVLNVKNTSKVLKPTKDSVMIYDGKDWYVTTKETLFKEWTDLLKQCNNKIEELERQHTEFKIEVSSQLREMTELIHTLFKTKGEDL